MKLLGLFVLAVTAVLSNAISQGTISEHLPYVVLIESRNPSTGTARFGGGSLITQRHVLTAASNLFQFTQFIVSMGSALRTMRAFTTTTATPHPQYVQLTRANDIGILTLPQAVIMSADINIIALPLVFNPPIILPFEFEEGAVSGMGFSSAQSNSPSQFLYRGFQRVTSVVRCNQFFNLPQLSGFCAEDTIERSNVCQGDVGGPFVVSYRRSDTLVGIVTMPAPCGQNSPSAYTRITNFRTWIQSIAQI
ncbi:unnamed protein product [Diamesa serratosioi]